jgi:GNAT superfamily N-acetyltransferase
MTPRTALAAARGVIHGAAGRGCRRDDGAVTDVPHWPLRFAAPQDAAAIAALQQSAVLASCASWYSAPQLRALVARLSPEAVEHELRRRRGRVALDDGAICGFCSTSVGAGRIEALYVAPFAAHRGVGHALVADAEEAMLTAGRTESSLISTRNAVDFYEWLGYVPGDDASLRLSGGVALTAVTMRRTLTPPPPVSSRT